MLRIRFPVSKHEVDPYHFFSEVIVFCGLKLLPDLQSRLSSHAKPVNIEGFLIRRGDVAEHYRFLIGSAKRRLID